MRRCSRQPPRWQTRSRDKVLADLRGARFVMTSETEEGQRLAEGKREEAVLDEIYTGAKAGFRPIHDKLMKEISTFGDFEVAPKKVFRTLPFIKPPFPWGIPIPFWRKTLDRYHITIQIEENEQYRVGDVRITGNTEFSDDLIRIVLGLWPGQVYNDTQLREGFENLTRLYGSRGFVNFSPLPIFDDDEVDKVRNININIDIDINIDINFNGNRVNHLNNNVYNRRQDISNRMDARPKAGDRPKVSDRKAAGERNNVLSDRDGNVFRKDSKQGWQQRNSDTRQWQKQDRPSAQQRQLERNQQSRQRSVQRTQQYRSYSGGGGGARRGGGGGRGGGGRR